MIVSRRISNIYGDEVGSWSAWSGRDFKYSDGFSVTPVEADAFELVELEPVVVSVLVGGEVDAAGDIQLALIGDVILGEVGVGGNMTGVNFLPLPWFFDKSNCRRNHFTS